MLRFVSVYDARFADALSTDTRVRAFFNIHLQFLLLFNLLVVL